MASDSTAVKSPKNFIGRKRKYNVNIYESRRRVRSRVNKTKLRMLDSMLNNWYIRTKVPTCALTLLPTKDGTLIVKYSGPSIFEEFGLNEHVAKVFTDIVLKNMDANRAELLSEQNEARYNENHSIDRVTSNVLLSEDVLSFGIDEKRRLLTQIITGHDMAQKRNWKTAKPLWWPRDVEFRSPNKRGRGLPTMPVSEMNKILSASIEYVKALSGSPTNEVGLLEDQQTSYEHKDSATPNIASQGVTYVKDGRSLAVGIPYFEKDSLNGHPIPSGHVCVQILAANENVATPCIIDNSLVENLTLSIGRFYALPLEDLRRHRLEKGQLILERLQDSGQF